jgi:hypothetical protein
VLNLSASCEACASSNEGTAFTHSPTSSASPAKIKCGDRRASRLPFAAAWSCMASPPTSI